MSLINDVLRDLEKRRMVDGAALNAARAEPVRRGKRIVWTWLAPVAGVAVVVVYLWPGVTVNAPAPTVERPAPVVVDRRVQLQTASLMRDGGRLELVLGLNGPVDYRTERADGGRSVTLHLPRVVTTVSLPPLEGIADSASLRKSDDGVTLSLALAEPVTVRTALDQGPEETQLRLVLTAEQSQQPTPAVTVALAEEPKPSKPVAVKTATVVPVAKPQATKPTVAVPTAAPAERVGEFHKQRIPPTPTELAARAYADAMRAQQAGQPSVAEGKLREALTYQRAHIDASQALAQLLATQGRTAEAEQVLRNGLVAADQPPTLVQQLARVLFAKGEDAEAIGVLEAGLGNAGADGDYLALLAAGYQRQGRFAPAADLYTAALRQRPSHGPWHIGRAIALESAGDRAAAADAYRAALQSRLATELQEYARQRVRALGLNSGPE